MDNQIKYYLHIQKIKQLYNEINKIKKHMRECKLQNLVDQMQNEILNREELILKIIGIYDLLEYYYCTGDVEKLKQVIKNKEEETENYFKLEEIDKYIMMIDVPNNI